MKLILNATIAMILVLSCDHPFNQADNENEFTTRFELKNSAGVITDTFARGENIRLEYEIRNISGRRQPLTLPDTGPIVEFEILKQGVSQGTSTDGFSYAPVIQTDTLAAGMALSASYSWFSVDEHDTLTAGQYVAEVRPRFQLSDAATPGKEQRTFAVTDLSTALGTDTVRITNQSAASLQLDPFTLNSASINGTTLTLNVSFGGGCEEHHFELYMSPATFMESNPVQANLFLRHNGNGDPCDAYLTEDLAFNLQPLLDLHLQQYGGPDDIILNLFHYFESQPDSSLSILYRP